MPKVVLTANKQQALILLLFTLILGIVSYINLFTGPMDPVNVQEIMLRIPRGSTTGEIAVLLDEKGLIKSPKLFTLFSAVFGFDDDLKAGYYRLNTSMSLWSILQNLRHGRIATYKVTIPEGFEIEKIAALLAKKGVDKEEFLRLAREGDFSFSFLPPENDFQGKYRLEGFLFPDTYFFPIGACSRLIIETMLENFERQFLTPFAGEINKSSLGIVEIVTLASLIEKEAKLDRERELISAVIYNRLDRGMLLQIDASVVYCLNEERDRLYYKDLKIECPYNTYRNKGLPPGPIASPGLESLKAALNPADVDFLFYVARPDGSHIFTTKYHHHLQVQRGLTR